MKGRSKDRFIDRLRKFAGRRHHDGYQGFSSLARTFICLKVEADRSHPFLVLDIREDSVRGNVIFDLVTFISVRVVDFKHFTTFFQTAIMPPVTTADAQEQQASTSASSSILKERRFKLSR